MNYSKSSARRVLSLILNAALMISLVGIALSAGSITASAAGSYDSSGATTFTFTDSSITVSEGNYTGYKIDGTTLTINESGTYIVTGSCSDGSIKVKKGTTGVTLVLDDLSLTSSTTAPLACNKSTQVDIIIEGTVSLEDSKANSEDYLMATYGYAEDAEELEDAENAVIKLKDGSQVTISGTGTLNVTANAKNGVKGGATTTDEGTASLTVSGITMNIDTTNAYDPGDGDTYGDGFNVESTLSILSGTYTISAGDDAIHSDYTLNIGESGADNSSLKITVNTCYEGLEAATLNVYSGDITIHSSDDGLNAANSDLTDYDFAMNIYGGDLYIDGQDDGLDSNGTLTISGGNIVVFCGSAADNAPLDADGTITISGGTVLGVGQSGMAQLPNSTTQAYVYYGYGANGMGGMGGQPGQNSSTSSGVSISKGDTITITDASGNTVATETALRNATFVFYTSPDLTEGETYTLSVGGTESGTCTATTEGSQSSGMPGGQQPGQGGVDTSVLSQYTDVSEDAWYSEAVAYVSSNNLMVGTGNSKFSPNSEITRAMVAQVLYRMAGSPSVSSSASSSFSDVSSGSWYCTAVTWAYENGIFAGYGDGTFRPNQSITREQLVTVLYQYLKSNGEDVSATSDLSQFTDASSVSNWAQTYVKWAVGEGLLSGMGNGILNPKGTATRAQFAQILYSAFGKDAQNPGMPGNGQMPGNGTAPGDGQTPPEMPGDGQTPPEMPNSSTSSAA